LLNIKHGVGMSDFLLQQQASLKFAFAGLLLLGLFVWQRRAPWRNDGRSTCRVRTNFALIVVATIINRIVIPMSSATVVLWTTQKDWGLLQWLNISSFAKFLCALIVLDFAIYWQHRAFHYFSFGWRVHRVHHSDTGFDMSTGLRFHPLEIIPSTLYKMTIAVAIGAPAAAVVAHELLLLGMSIFTHADIRLPTRFERILRVLIVTPDMHRVHHSVYNDELQSNFSNTLSVWDRLFGTYTSAPRDGHPTMQIGLLQLRDISAQNLPALLKQPFLHSTIQSEQPYA
jgi:sterol desaturase/sphingolipid hydroxylase (fatty acid hydroxylase superfamily)